MKGIEKADIDRFADDWFGKSQCDSSCKMVKVRILFSQYLHIIDEDEKAKCDKVNYDCKALKKDNKRMEK